MTATERRTYERREAPSHATIRELAVIGVIDSLVDPDPEDRMTEGFNTALSLIRSVILNGIASEGR